MQNYYYPTYPYYPSYRQIPEQYESDQRFFPLLLPFVAGLAIGPLLFNRPIYPAPYPVPYPTPYPIPYPTPYPSSPGYGGGYPSLPQQYPVPVQVQVPTTENINIYPR